MLVYEKKVNGEQKLFGTMGSVPADNDVQLTYKDKDGDVITPVANDTYKDNSKDGIQGIIRTSDEKDVNVFIGDTCIIGKVEEKVVTKLEVSPSKLNFNSGDELNFNGVVVKAVYADGDKVEITNYTAVPAAGTILATTDTKVTFTYQGKSAEITLVVKAREAKNVDTLKAALAAGGEVKLTSNINTTEVLTITKNTDLNLNGKSITIPAENTSLNWVMLVDGGTLKLSNGSIDGSDGEAYGLYVKNSGTAELTDVNIKGDTEAVQVNEGTATINSGTFEAKPYDDGQGGDQYRYTLNLVDSAYTAGTGHIIVKGGQFYKYNPANSTSENPPANFVAAGFKSVADGDYYKVIAE